MISSFWVSKTIFFTNMKLQEFHQTFTITSFLGFKSNAYTNMKTQDFHSTNVYELTNLVLTLSKLVQSQVTSSEGFCRSRRFSLLVDLVSSF